MNEKNGLPTLEDKSIDLGITDIPFNIDINSKGKVRDKFCTIRNNSTKYNDKIEDFPSFMKSVFLQLERICNGFIIYCGGKNVDIFYNIKKPRQTLYRYASNCFSRGSLTHRMTIFPMVAYGKFNSRIGNDLFKYPSHLGFLRKEDLIHPCPLNAEFWYDLIKQLKPTSVVDPFIGSGTTAEVCTKLGIPWIGYEINEIYSQDINKRLNRINLSKSGLYHWLK